MKPGITLVLINYNSKDMLDGCLQRIQKQTYPNITTIFIDNESQDGSCEHVEQNYPEVIAVCNNANLGYSKGANQGIKMSETPYVMILNPDVMLEPDYIEKCIAKMERDSQLAAITGKIYRYDFENDKKTKQIDTVGLFCFANRRIIDDGQGLTDHGQFDKEQEVFGVSGACPIYRKEALDDIKVMGEYLDADFFMYKEDVDLSWRLRLRGWNILYYPKVIAYHGRGTGVLKRFTHMEVLKNRSKLNRFQKYYSFKNQRLMQAKNEMWPNFFKNFFPIVGKEILIAGYVIFREPYLIKAWFHMLKQLPRAFKKRRIIMKNKKATWKQMDQWLNGKQSQYAPKNAPKKSKASKA